MLKYPCYIPIINIFLLSFGMCFSSFADHVVGGNIEMVCLGTTPGKYKIVTKMYYDRVKVHSSTADLALRIYRKKDRATMLLFPIFRVDSKRQLLKFTNETCAEQNQLEIVLDIFETEIKLDPAVYNDPEGYIIVWNGCCRSQAISNINSPDLRGIPFYLEFSPLIKDGKPFVDSTPEFDELDGEYVCIGDDFTYSFDATDRDGDELRYSLVTPYSYFDDNFATTAPVGFRSTFVEWQPGYSATNAIRGNPPLSIDPKYGELSVKATEVGLFTFTVLVEEYRKGEKIGAARRDYQLFVFDCPPLIPPDPTITINDQVATQATACQGSQITLKATANPNWGYQWKKDGDNIPNANSPTLTVTENGTYQLVTYLSDKCSKTRRSRKVKVDFTKSNFKLKTNTPPYICSNGSSTLVLESPANDNYTYEWYSNGQLLSGNSKSNLQTNQAGKYWAIIRDVTKGCSSFSDTVTVTSVEPIKALFINDQDSKICNGTSIELQIKNPSGFNVLKWLKNGQELINEKNPLLIANQPGVYQVMAIDTNGCSSESGSLKIEVVEKIIPTLDSLPDLCGTDHPPILLNGIPSGGVYGGDGVTNQLFDPKKAGIGTHTITYSVRGTITCQDGMATRTLVITPPPVINLGEDKSLYLGGSTTINGDLGGGYTYQWSPTTALSNPNGGQTEAAPEKTTTYTLVALGPNSCKVSDSITIQVIYPIYIPDVFTPNGDGINDVWKLTGINSYPEVEITIFNRWGELVFYQKGNKQPAFDGLKNGELLPTGVYAYVIKTNGSNGHIFRGAVTLIR